MAHLQGRVPQLSVLFEQCDVLSFNMSTGHGLTTGPHQTCLECACWLLLPQLSARQALLRL